MNAIDAAKRILELDKRKYPGFSEIEVLQSIAQQADLAPSVATALLDLDGNYSAAKEVAINAQEMMKESAGRLIEAVELLKEVQAKEPIVINSPVGLKIDKFLESIK